MGSKRRFCKLVGALDAAAKPPSAGGGGARAFSRVMLVMLHHKDGPQESGRPSSAVSIASSSARPAPRATTDGLTSMRTASTVAQRQPGHAATPLARCATALFSVRPSLRLAGRGCTASRGRTTFRRSPSLLIQTAPAADENFASTATLRCPSSAASTHGVHSAAACRRASEPPAWTDRRRASQARRPAWGARPPQRHHLQHDLSLSAVQARLPGQLVVGTAGQPGRRGGESREAAAA